MTLPSLTALDGRKTGGFPAGYPRNLRTFYAPVDDIHGVLLDLIQSASRSLVLAMYALDDPELTGAVRAKALNPRVTVQITLDSYQAASAHESVLLSQTNFPATSIAVGLSEHGAAMHLKELVVDGLYTAGGSTNWSPSGQRAQDNQLVVVKHRVVAAEATARLAAIHAGILARHPAPGGTP